MKISNIMQALLIIIILFIAPVARGDTVFDIEYVPEASGYESAFGAGFYQLTDEGFGFYGNLQATLASREPKYESLTVSSFGDPVTNRYKDLAILDIGMTRKFTPNIAAYAGVGYASAKGIAQKNDPTGILGKGGVYYVNDPQNDQSNANFNAGIIITLEKLNFNIGYLSFTKSAYFGFGWKF